MKEFMTVTLNPAVDQTVEVPEFRPGKDHRYENAYRSAGGKGINVARALRGLGVDCRAIGFLGGSNGAYIRRELRKEKIPQQFIAIEQETRTSWTVIDRKTGKNTRLLDSGPVVSPRERAAFKRTFRQLLLRSEVVVLSGRSVPGVSDGFYAELIRLCRRAGRRAVLDTSGTPLVKGIAAKPFLIKPNRAETEYLLGQKLRTAREMKQAVTALRRRGVERVILSLGERGAVTADGDDFLWARPPRVKSVSSVGCGDALIGGFLTAWSRNKPLRECLQWGVAAGTANAINLQPGRVTRKALREILPRVRVEKI